MTETPYTIFGYKGRQVRDVIRSNGLVRAFDAFYRKPGVAGTESLKRIISHGNKSIINSVVQRRFINGDLRRRRRAHFRRRKERAGAESV